MTRVKWKKVGRGERVELNGREWIVDKVKPKGKRLRVVVRSGQHVIDAKVDPDAKVRLAEDEPTAKPKRREVKPATPPKPATGDPWETQQDRVERKLDQILGARLVGEATDTDAGYYVPVVDLGTVAGHVAIFHGVIPPEYRHDAQGLLGWHAREHLAAEAGNRELPINHWHSEKRPTTAGKKTKR